MEDSRRGLNFHGIVLLRESRGLQSLNTDPFVSPWRVPCGLELAVTRAGAHCAAAIPAVLILSVLRTLPIRVTFPIIISAI